MGHKRGLASGVLGKKLGRVVIDDPLRDDEPDVELQKKHAAAVARLRRHPYAIRCPRCYKPMTRARSLPVPQLIERTCTTCDQTWSVHVRPQPDQQPIIDFRPVTP